VAAGERVWPVGAAATPGQHVRPVD
jgi:hypothetical protein